MIKAAMKPASRGSFVNQGVKQMNTEEKATEFIIKLRVFTQKYLNPENENDFQKDTESLRALFDDFAIIDVFSSMHIVDCYNEIKISLMKWERFADKNSSILADFKKLLDYFHKKMKDIYFYEIFGFFSTTVHPEDIPELNLPCKVFCGCAEGWQREPYLNEDGKVEYLKVVRFQDPENNEIPLCIKIGGCAELIEPREKCSLTDEQLRILCNFVNHNRGSIILHIAGVLDSKQFFNALEFRDKIYKSKYCIEFEYVRKADSRHPSGPYYVDMNDMTFSQAQKFYKNIWKEIRLEPENLDAAYPLYSLKVIKRRPASNSCCFCKKIFNGEGNSTWPIYYKEDSEYYRCCDACNEKFVIAARKDRSKIMQFRKQFGIDYAEYQE